VKPAKSELVQTTKKRRERRRRKERCVTDFLRLLRFFVVCTSSDLDCERTHP
jgi:hypothetical protein